MEDGLTLKDNNVYNRHLSARRISHLMLMGQQQQGGAGGNLEKKPTGQFHSKSFDRWFLLTHFADVDLF